MSNILELRSTMNGETISTNTSRKSSIGSLSIVSIADHTEENTCRKASIQSFSNISLANSIGEDKLQGIYAKCHFLVLSISTLMSFLQYFVKIFCPMMCFLLSLSKLEKKQDKKQKFTSHL